MSAFAAGLTQRDALGIGFIAVALGIGYVVGYLWDRRNR